ncbi:nucleoside recognition domain-containing protein [Bengtsoniella intestinalis]|uniref:YjiH family protein n=1 Tax=Bengtsoniella intestinalis TaxID=3073143 RepID=UPI00391F1B44
MKQENRIKNISKLVVFTGIGILYYMVPFTYQGDLTMCVALLKDIIIGYFSQYLILFTVVSMIAIAIATLFYSTVGAGKLSNALLKSLLEAKVFTICMRIAAAVISILVYLNVGPEELLSADTGGLIVEALIPSLICLFFFALLLISFLLEFGAVELIGKLLQPIFKPLFKVRGSGAILSIVSWLGVGTTGMVLIDKSFENDQLTQREAVTMSLCFATISFPSMFVYSTGIAGLEIQYFSALVITILVAMVISTVILARIPTISKKNHTISVAEENKKQSWKETFDLAITRAGNGPTIATMFKKACTSMFCIFIEVFPSIIVIATAVLVLATYTPAFDIIAMPIAPLLTLLGLPEAQAAAPALIIGISDLILPYIIASTITSQLTIFVICVVSINQVFCFSEQVVVLLKSKMGVNLVDILVNFILKTIICVPIAYFLGVLFGLS